MNNKKGFTLIEVLLVVAIIAIIAGIVILAVNPKKQLDDSNDARRRADVNTIINGVYQYIIDNGGRVPAVILSTTTQICATSASTTQCTPFGLVDLSFLSDRYLVSIPIDPSGATTTNGTGYYIERTTGGRIRVSAPASATTSPTIISATR